MIVRMWRGQPKPGAEQDYLSHLRDSVIPEIRAIDGFLGAKVLRGATGSAPDVLVITYWRDMVAIGQFAGDEPHLAVVPAAAQLHLAEFDPFVEHYEVVLEES